MDLSKVCSCLCYAIYYHSRLGEHPWKRVENSNEFETNKLPGRQVNLGGWVSDEIISCRDTKHFLGEAFNLFSGIWHLD